MGGRGRGGAAPELAAGPGVTAEEMALGVKNKASEKYDEMLPEGLLAVGYAGRMLDLEGGRGLAAALLGASRTR